MRKKSDKETTQLLNFTTADTFRGQFEKVHTCIERGKKCCLCGCDLHMSIFSNCNGNDDDNDSTDVIMMMMIMMMIAAVFLLLLLMIVSVTKVLLLMKVTQTASVVFFLLT